MRYAILALVVLLNSGCAIQRAHVADEAQHQMVGMSRGQVLACMGTPADRRAEGPTEVWSYPSGGKSVTFATGQSFGSASGTYSGVTNGPFTTGTASGYGSSSAYGISTTQNRYCVVNVVFNGEQVSAINYQGNTGGLLTQGEQCAFAIQNCVHGDSSPTSSSVASPSTSGGGYQTAGLSPDRQVVQDALYAGCYHEGKLGSTPAELDSNCRCHATYGEPLVAPEARQAATAGKAYNGPVMFVGGWEAYFKAVLPNCPGVKSSFRAYAQQMVASCGGSQPGSQDCQAARDTLALLDSPAQSGAVGPSFPSLQAFARTNLQQNIESYPEDARDKLLDCGAYAVVADIPQSDQEQMLNVVNSGKLGAVDNRIGAGMNLPGTDEYLFKKWFGILIGHGPIQTPSLTSSSSYAGGTLHFADGTIVPPPDSAVQARVKANASRFCPDLAQRYPKFFQ